MIWYIFLAFETIVTKESFQMCYRVRFNNTKFGCSICSSKRHTASHSDQNKPGSLIGAAFCDLTC